MNGDVPRKNKYGRRRCRCADVCRMTTRARSIMRNMNPREVRKLVRDLLDNWAQAAENEQYLRAILDGTWPSSLEQLTGAIARAMAVRAGRKA